MYLPKTVLRAMCRAAVWLLMTACASCHGRTNRTDGVAAGRLSHASASRNDSECGHMADTHQPGSPAWVAPGKASNDPSFGCVQWFLSAQRGNMSMFHDRHPGSAVQRACSTSFAQRHCAHLCCCMQAALPVEASGATKLVFRWRCIARAYPPRRPVYLTHVPKAAGSSLNVDLVQSLAGRLNFSTEEACFLSFSKKGALNFIMLRSPRAHVLSQYYQCRYGRRADRSGFGGPVAPYERHPTLWTGPAMSGFSNWVAFFARNWTFSPSARGDQFCYNPRDYQTRALTCRGKHTFASLKEREVQALNDPKASGNVWLGGHLWQKWALENGHHAGAELPSTDDAIRSLGAASAVGIVEHYHLSVCLFLFEAGASAHMTMPRSCLCGLSPAAAAEKHNAHGLPAHTLDDVSPAALQLVDTITRRDAVVYAHALRLFATRVREMNASVFARTGYYVC